MGRVLMPFMQLLVVFAMSLFLATSMTLWHALRGVQVEML